MDKKTFDTIYEYVRMMMTDSAHDLLHIDRVLYQALNISTSYPEVNQDVLISSCLLHDIGRNIQFQNPKLCHALEGGKLAYKFMKELGWPDEICCHIKDCISTHRFRKNSFCESIEAKILFDADKLDVTGALGIARSLMYEGKVGEPLYVVDDKRKINTCLNSYAPESFYKEFNFKLIKLYDFFYTNEAKIIASQRKKIAVSFFESLIEEINYSNFNELLEQALINK